MTSAEFLFCPIRKEFVNALPEEKVRQRIISHMLSDLGFPESLIVIEKALRLLPHLPQQDKWQVPDRRADIICFAKGIHAEHDLYPLLTIECKAIPLSKRVLNQIAGYNHFVRSYFIAVVNQDTLKMGWFDTAKGEYQFIDYLPTFEELRSKILGNQT